MLIPCGFAWSLQRIQSELDSHAYKHRVADAIRHSQYLSRSFPVAVVKPTWNDLITARSPESVLRARKEARNQPESRETYQSLLSQLDAAEYSEPERKRLKTEGQVAIKEDQVAGIKKQNESLFRKLQKELNGKKRSPLITRWKPTPRLQMAKNTVTKSEKVRNRKAIGLTWRFNDLCVFVCRLGHSTALLASSSTRRTSRSTRMRLRRSKVRLPHDFHDWET